MVLATIVGPFPVGFLSLSYCLGSWLWGQNQQLALPCWRAHVGFLPSSVVRYNRPRQFKTDGMLPEQGYPGLPSLEFSEPYVTYFLQGSCLYKQFDEEANCKIHRPLRGIGTYKWRFRIMGIYPPIGACKDSLKRPGTISVHSLLSALFLNNYVSPATRKGWQYCYYS